MPSEMTAARLAEIVAFLERYPRPHGARYKEGQGRANWLSPAEEAGVIARELLREVQRLRGVEAERDMLLDAARAALKEVEALCYEYPNTMPSLSMYATVNAYNVDKATYMMARRILLAMKGVRTREDGSSVAGSEPRHD